MCTIVSGLKELSATASDTAPVSIERCFALVADVEHYPDWYSAGVKRVEVLERGDDQRARLVATVLSVGDGPIRKDFNLNMAVTTTEPSAVDLSRVKEDAANGELMAVSWALAPADAAATQLTVALRAALNLPPFLPVGAIAQSVANGFLAAALARLGSSES